MLDKIIALSLKNKLIVLLLVVLLIGAGIFSLTKISFGALPDITNNQVQVITTSRNLATQDVEQFITYPIELEMTNLPGVVEIRSVSKFGLSVVTIVFEDEMGTYLPRQLIAEKIKTASEAIPEGFGSPNMGPISTGLGEIFQYTLEVAPEYKNHYTDADLRTIQDWIVKRQLSGISGVVEINTSGGHLKQYEITIQPQRLNAMDITISQLFTALKKNNSNAGGGYIEKSDKAYFIRGEGLIGSLKDIENTVVANRNGNPVYIKDVAKVGFGYATRFGAVTGNGEGEKVLGQIIMLKGANSNKVIEAVKERVAKIQKSLPEGVYINGFLERSELIKRVTYTISENLILGSLIVIFVVVLLLGNWRSGLVVASVIPLSLLFALTLMNFFGVSANLMSLGAIDFGIIIDGTVIIVEFIAFKITEDRKELNHLSRKEQQISIDKITKNGASKMMKAAIFGQLIILIVFIPIFTLSGIEGKLFKPMALTFSFALLGAIIMCLTYVPVISSMIVKPSQKGQLNISEKIINTLNKRYKPLLAWALIHKKTVLIAATIFFGISVLIFSKMGGEFVPTLDEGDFAIQPVLPSGTSLGKTIEITTQIEQILLEEFPEVEQVISRIGAAEVPTDPMSMEDSDLIIKLKPKGEWVSANSKDGLAEKIRETLAVIPNMEIEFTQPIEMRFNELITGARADIAIKIFGEDLAVLSKTAEKIKSLIADVPGAADIVVEKVTGLPQMMVKYNRAKIARYGLNIDDVNQVITMGYAGKTFGSVFENEKRFDLVMRLDKDYRISLDKLENLYIDTPNGAKVPLSELAEITLTKGPAQISRDNTRRRITVGINVRNSDLETVVEKINAIIEKNVKLPPGYEIDYGGQFENMQQALRRLKIAVPISLILIFVLLYFAFHSVKEALLVYSAIPLAAVGGVLLLALRGMPFSISAGIGFIALFGIAVLNGIVLIEHFKELKKNKNMTLSDRIITGATDRLRPVLLTATAAALGFLPMALSTNSGAEVQRPLATVVIGGLITATLLTLLVLPVLYHWLEKRASVKRNQKLLGLLFLLGTTAISAQNTSVSVEEAMALAIKNNAHLRTASLQVEESKSLINSAFDVEKTALYYEYDKNNLGTDGLPVHKYGVSQNFEFPTLYITKKRRNKIALKMEEEAYKTAILKLKKEVAQAYYQVLYAKNKLEVYAYLERLYRNFSNASERRFELGETNYLEKITAQAKAKQIANLYNKTKHEIAAYRENLLKLVQVDSIAVADAPLLKLPVESVNILSSSQLAYLELSQSYAEQSFLLEKQNLLPDLNAGYFIAYNSGIDKRLTGYELGIRIPLIFGGKLSKIKSAKIHKEVSSTAYKDFKIRLSRYYQSLLAKLKANNTELSFYRTEGKSLSEELLKSAESSFKHGEIDYFQYIQILENAKQIQLDYLENLNQYNQTVININYLTL